MNTFIKEARQLACELLQLTPAQLEHGESLHEASLVVDTYGFAPRADVDTKMVEAAAEAGATPAELELLCHEVMMTGVARDPRESELFAQAFRVAGVDCLFQNAGQEGNDVEVLLRRLARFNWVTDNLPSVLRRVVTPEDVVTAHSEGKRTLYLTTNGVPLPRTMANSQEGVSYIQTFAQLGVKMMHLTYNRRNLIGDGCGEPRDAGLSVFGADVVREMNRCGVIPDVAHSSNQTTIDAARVSSRPVVISHATCGALSSHCRAKSDAAIRAVADTDGYIGICCMAPFLQRSGDIVSLLDHIDHAVQLVGADHVAIGTDTMAMTHASQVAQIEGSYSRPSRPSMESLWPEQDGLYDPHWQNPRMWHSLTWTNWPLFTAGLVQRGHSDTDIQKIIGLNALRVMRATQVAQ